MAFIDAYENTAADYEEIPELTEADLTRGWWEIDGVRVDEVGEGMTLTERVELELGGDVLAAYRAGGPDWRDRMAEALRKAVGL